VNLAGQLRNPLVQQSSNPHPHWHPGPALAAWAVPGLGHFLLGERRRGVILFAAILSLWLGGVLIGGLGVLDRTQQPHWFLGQMLLAPSVLVDNLLQNQIKPRYQQPPRPDRPAAYEPSFGRVNEQGVLYTALAGLLNLLAIIDVLYRDPRAALAHVESTPKPGVAP
jgi:hypothetical protein